MRILQVITDTDRRGAQVFATDLAPALAALGHRVDTVALAPGAQGSPLPVETLGSTRLGVATLRALRTRAAAVDVVVAHGSSTLPACAVATFAARTPFVYRQISDSLFWAPTAARRARVRASLSRARRVVTLSDAQADVLVAHFGVRRARIDVVPNGVPGGRFPEVTPADRDAARAALGLASDAVVVLCVSALVPEKGVDLVLDAAAALDDARVTVIVAGDGPERTRLDALADERLGVRARLLGPLADPVPAYAAADLVVLASRGGDSMPAALIEAALCGLPAVVTPIGAIAEVVEDGITGLVVPVDDPGALRAALADLVAHPARRQALGHAARQRALARYEIGVVAAGWEAALLAATGHPRADGSEPSGSIQPPGSSASNGSS